MRFLFDECLHTSLPERCWAAGHEAHHVEHLGLKGTKDPDLMPIILEGSYTFVTNNARDFRRLFLLEELHAGLVVVLPNVPPPEQVELLDAVLVELAANGDLVNQSIQVDFVEDQVRVRRLDMASPS